MTEKEEDKRDAHECDVCKFATASKNDIEKLETEKVEKKRNERDKLVESSECEKCGEKFTETCDLKTHARKENKLRCEECGEKFGVEHDLENHMRIEHGAMYKKSRDFYI